MAVVFSALAINSVFFSPHNVPNEERLLSKTVRSVRCVADKSGNAINYRVKAIISGVEAKTYDMEKNRCLDIQNKSSSKNGSTLLLEKDPIRIFGEGWLIYQIKTDDKLVLPYSEASAEHLQNRRVMFYISLAFLIVYVLAIANGFYQDYRRENA